MVNIQFKHLEEIIDSLTRLSDPTILPVQLSVRIARVKRLLIEQQEIKQDLKNKIVKQFGVTNESGEVQLQPFQKGWTEAVDKIKELDETQFQVDLALPLDVLQKEYEKKPFPGFSNILSALLPFIIEEANETK